jgi:alpha-glucosidase
MKNKFFILILVLIQVACVDSKAQNDNTILGNEMVTFVVKDLPKNHNFNDAVYISGDFEGWSGGQEEFKLNQVKNTYIIDLPKYKESISYKFTKGSWGLVECQLDGNPMDNRLYSFEKTKDTILVSILNWNDERQQNKPSTAEDNVHVFAEEFFMPQFNRKRKISVYLPPNYQTSNARFPVLYIQDGQNVFDVATSYSGEWEVDETLNRIYNETGFGLIVVAINHGNDKRLTEYSAWDNLKYGKGEGLQYLDFLVNTLKPEIDKAYRTKSDSENTAVMGSSLGGLFAHYAAISKPEVFGKAGVFSPSFWYTNEIFEFTKTRSNLKNSKMFFLVGDNEGETMVQPMQNMVLLMKENGFKNQHIFAKQVANGTHSESFWKSEFREAITWLFNVNNNKE